MVARIALLSASEREGGTSASGLCLPMAITQAVFRHSGVPIVAQAASIDHQKTVVLVIVICLCLCGTTFTAKRLNSIGIELLGVSLLHRAFFLICFGARSPVFASSAIFELTNASKPSIKPLPSYPRAGVVRKSAQLV